MFSLLLKLIFLGQTSEIILKEISETLIAGNEVFVSVDYVHRSGSPVRSALVVLSPGAKHGYKHLKRVPLLRNTGILRMLSYGQGLVLLQTDHLIESSKIWLSYVSRTTQKSRLIGSFEKCFQLVNAQINLQTLTAKCRDRTGNESAPLVKLHALPQASPPLKTLVSVKKTNPLTLKIHSPQKKVAIPVDLSSLFSEK